MPDFANLRKAFLCQGEPARVPALEYSVDPGIKARFLGRILPPEAKVIPLVGYVFAAGWMLMGFRRFCLIMRRCCRRGPFQSRIIAYCGRPRQGTSVSCLSAVGKELAR